ncbi:SDR family oxidoreductase [Latilactobacillus sakei]
MKIFVIGAHGNIGQLLIPKLVAAGHIVSAGIRNEAQATEMTALGATPVSFDLTKQPKELAPLFADHDAIVFTAGSGGKTGDDQTLLVDLDGAVRSMAAAKIAEVKRYVMVSALFVEDRAKWPESIKPYYAAKYYADHWLEFSGLDWTILRPGTLTNDAGTAQFTMQPTGGQVARADVAAMIQAVLEKPEQTIHHKYSFVNGDLPIQQAIEQAD